MLPFVLLLIAIAVEVIATSLLPRAAGFTDPFWSIVVIAGYVAAIWLLTVVVKSMDVSIAYAIWAGLGTAGVAVVGYLWLDEGLGAAKIAGIALIVVGVVLVNLQSA